MGVACSLESLFCQAVFPLKMLPRVVALLVLAGAAQAYIHTLPTITSHASPYEVREGVRVSKASLLITLSSCNNLC